MHLEKFDDSQIDVDHKRQIGKHGYGDQTKFVI